MLEVVERMSRSHDWLERVRAARLAARLEPASSESIVLRLLGDAKSAAVSEAMVSALLEARREAAVPLILRRLGEERASGQFLLEGLLNSELDGLEMRGAVVSVLLETLNREELVGALGAIVWLAPGGGFPAPPAAWARVAELTESADEAVRVLAREVLDAFAGN